MADEYTNALIGQRDACEEECDKLRAELAEKTRELEAAHARREAAERQLAYDLGRLNAAEKERPPVTIRKQVLAFHHKFGQPILHKPQVPSRERVALRIRLIAEEFCELLEALGAPKSATSAVRDDATYWLANIERPDVDLPEAIDALADLDYVIEGTRIEFGVKGQPIADEVHRTNMAKIPGLMRSDGKICKPPDWQPPRIRELLVLQGWDGE